MWRLKSQRVALWIYTCSERRKLRYFTSTVSHVWHGCLGFVLWLKQRSHSVCPVTVCFSRSILLRMIMKKRHCSDKKATYSASMLQAIRLMLHNKHTKDYAQSIPTLISYDFYYYYYLMHVNTFLEKLWLFYCKLSACLAHLFATGVGLKCSISGLHDEKVEGDGVGEDAPLLIIQ